MEGPWPNFVDSVRAEIDRLVVSHRISRKVSGAIHEETIYSPPIPMPGNNGQAERHVRKPLAAFTKSDLDAIADETVKQLVIQKLDELGGDIKKFSDEKNLPAFVTATGRRVPIRNVRIHKPVSTFQLGEGRDARHVVNESNHHLEIYAEVKPDGNEGKWDGEVVPMWEAYKRRQEGKPIVQRDHGPLAKFKFSLAPGEIIECEPKRGEKGLFVVRSVSQFARGTVELGLVAVTDARKKKDIISSGNFLRPAVETLRRWQARKVSISPLGELTEAHD